MNKQSFQYKIYLRLQLLGHMLFSDVTYPALLNSNQSLEIGPSIFSNNSCFQLKLLSNGNLILFRVDDNVALWKTNTSGKYFIILIHLQNYLDLHLFLTF